MSNSIAGLAGTVWTHTMRFKQSFLSRISVLFCHNNRDLVLPHYTYYFLDLNLDTGTSAMLFSL